MSDCAVDLGALTSAARHAVSGTGVKVWHVDLTGRADGGASLDVASSRGPFRIPVPKLPVGEGSVEVLCAYVARAVREAVEEEHRRQAPAPDLMEYIVGFRAWRLRADALAPLHNGVNDWDGGKEVRATCGEVELFRRRTGAIAYMRDGREPRPRFAWHEAPDTACECGLYAWHSVTMLAPEPSRSRTVIGAVAARGVVEVHPRGFRAQFARPVLFAYGDHDRDDVTALGLLHGVEVCAYDELGELARRFGQPVPETLRA